MQRRTGRAQITALVGALMAMLAGCSTVQDLAGVPRSGYQDDGTYRLSDQDQQLGCRALEQRSSGLQGHLADLSREAVVQTQKLPDTLVSAWGRIVNSPELASPAVAEYNEARAQKAAVDASLSAKGCASIETAGIAR